MSIDGPYWPNELLIIKMALMDIALRFYSRFWLCGITVKKNILAQKIHRSRPNLTHKSRHQRRLRSYDKDI